MSDGAMQEESWVVWSEVRLRVGWEWVSMRDGEMELEMEMRRMLLLLLHARIMLTLRRSIAQLQ